MDFHAEKTVVYTAVVSHLEPILSLHVEITLSVSLTTINVEILF
jgi:hypothetical protein